ncbi:hypothetical protein F4859DRAFT_176638 [Xylaria cf. heliscus]|nr:hypothetical protein F4859DRAFT_176638 [Xylaria cf. heliscus]
MDSVMARSPPGARASAIPSSQSQTRSACNRCHQQKLRCIRTKEQTSCERCARLKTECRNRPRGRRSVRNGPPTPGPGAWVEPRSLAPATAPPAMPDMAGMSEDIDYDWLSFLNSATSNAEDLGFLGSDPGFPLQTAPGRTLAIGPCQSSDFAEPPSIDTLDNPDGEVLEIVPVHQDTVGAIRGNHSPLDHPHSPYGFLGYHNPPSRGLGRPIASTVGRLSSLSLALYECASKLPSIKTPQADSAGAANTPCAMESSSRRGGVLLALDEVFRVTNEFINFMKSPYSTPGCPEMPALTATPMATTPHLTQIGLSSDQQGFVTESAVSSPIQPFPHLDEASILLFLSCHCQLVEIYKSVFQAMRRCLEGSKAAPHSAAGIILPQLQVGGSGGISSPALRVDFNGPLLPQATISMYMSLITTMSSQLWAQVGDALRRGRGCVDSRSQASGPHLEVAAPTWGVAMERTDNMERTIELIKRML